jgi:ABC-type branched-subunit amino acid transport system substrate-binding protein
MIKIATMRLLAITQQLWFTKNLEDLQSISRRKLMQHSLQITIASPTLLCALALQPEAAHSQTLSGKNADRSITVGQIVDMSPSQQDVSKDFLVGCRAAWQDINSRGGIRGRSINHLALETDGSAQSLQAITV